MGNFIFGYTYVFVNGTTADGVEVNANFNSARDAHNGAFNATTGHGHSGSVGDGPKLGASGLDLTANYAWTGLHTFSKNVTFDTTTLFVDSVNHRVGLGTILPLATSHLKGQDAISYFESTRGTGRTFRTATSGGNSESWELYDVTGSQRAFLYSSQTNNGGTGWDFYTNGTPRFRINSTGNSGLGVLDPGNALVFADQAFITWKDSGSSGNESTGIRGNGKTLEFAANGITSNFINTSGQYVNNLTTGTAPFVVASTTKVANLNADLLDGLDSTVFLKQNVSLDVDLVGGVNAGNTNDGGPTLFHTVNYTVAYPGKYFVKVSGTWDALFNIMGTVTAESVIDMYDGTTVIDTAYVASKISVSAGTIDFYALYPFTLSGIITLGSTGAKTLSLRKNNSNFLNVATSTINLLNLSIYKIGD